MHFVCLKSSDASGNVTSAINSPFRLEIDQVGPGSFDVITPTNIVASASPAFAWSEAEDAVRYKMVLALDAACQNVVETVEQATATFQTAKVLAHNSTHFVCVTAYDALNNATLASNSPYSFQVDTVAPVVQFVSTTLPQPLGKSNAAAINVAVVQNADLVAFRYALGPKSDATYCAREASYTDSTLPDPTRVLLPTQRIVKTLPTADGEYQLCAVGKDSHGNWTPLSSATKTVWKKDTSLPSGIIDVAPYCGTLNNCLRVISGVSNFVVSGTVADPDIRAAVGTTPAVPGSGIKDATINIRVGTNKYLNAVKTDFVASSAANALPVALSGGNFEFTFPASLLATNKTAGITGPYYITVTVRDQALNSKVLTSSFVWDTDAPTMPVVDPILVSSREASTTYLPEVSTRVNFVNVKLTANGTLSPVREYCFKYSETTTAPTAPVATDSCWTMVPEANQSINATLSGLPFTLPFIAGNYRIFAWVRDFVGNQSQVSSSPALVRYNPIRPPVFSHLYVTYSVSDHLPKSTNIVPPAVIPVGTLPKVYIRWTVTTSNPSVPPLKNLKIFYTKDDVNFIDTGLSVAPASRNPANCSIVNTSTQGTIPARFSGCVEYSLPSSIKTNEFLRFRIQAEDQDEAFSFGQTNAMHLPKFNFLAGNTETGLGSTATAATLTPKSTQNLVVHPSGRIFILDDRGILVVDPLDGVLKRYIAPFSSARKIALTPDGKLLVLESDQISSIDVTIGPSSKKTIVGGGGTFEDDVTRDARTIFFENTSAEALFFVSPAGHIYFQSGKLNKKPSEGARIRVAKPSGANYTVETVSLGSNPMAPLFQKFSGIPTDATQAAGIYPLNECFLISAAFTFTTSGTPRDMFPLFAPTGQTSADSSCWLNFPGHTYPSSADYASYRYVPSTRTFSLNNALEMPFLVLFGVANTSGVRESVYARYFQSLNGSLYARVIGTYENNNAIYKYNVGTNEWIRKAGALYGGECQDGTAALSCALTLSSVFVDAQDRIYMMDNNTVRVVQDDGRILTIAGESLNAGDSKNPLSARFSSIGTFDLYPKAGPLSGTQLSPENPAYVLSDMNGMRIRKFTENGLMETIAGTGVDAVNSTSTVWMNQDPKTLDISWGVDAPNGSLSVDEAGHIYTTKFQRLTPYKLESTINPTGTVTYRWKAITDKTNSFGGGYGPQVLGLSGSNMLFGTYSYLRGVLKTGNGRLYQMSKTFGTNNLPVVALSKPNAEDIVNNLYPFDADPTKLLCPTGTKRLDCNGPATGVRLPQASAINSTTWVIASSSTYGQPVARLVQFAVTANPANDKVEDILKIQNYRVQSFAFNADKSKLFMCLSDGRIYQQTMAVDGGPNGAQFTAVGSQAPDFVPSASNMIKFPIPGMTCGQSGSMVYNSNRKGGTLVFQYQHNGLQGIAEFVNPAPTP